MSLHASQLDQALRETGMRLACRGSAGTVRLYAVGGSAGMLAGLLPPARTTTDVDVMSVEPPGSWIAVSAAAREVAVELELPETWLNDECRIHAWRLLPGWQKRCSCVRIFGPLEVWALDRGDFIAAKVLSARTQDLADLLSLEPTPEELASTEAHIDRLESEHLDSDHSLEDARAILRALRGEP